MGDPFPITLEVSSEHLIGAVSTLAALVLVSLLAKLTDASVALAGIPASFALGAWAARAAGRRLQRVRQCRHDRASGDRCPACQRR